MLLLVLLALLFLPVDFYGRLDPDLQAGEADGALAGSVRWQLRLRLGWGLLWVGLQGQDLSVAAPQLRLLGWRLRLPGGGGRRGQRAEAAGKGRRSRKGRPKRRRQFTLEVGQALLAEGQRLLQRLWRDLGWRLTGELCYGLGDPSLTGACEAVLWTIKSQGRPAGEPGRPPGLAMHPDWLEPRLQGWAELQGRIYGVEVVLAGLAWLRNPALRRYVFRRPKAQSVTAGGKAA